MPAKKKATSKTGGTSASKKRGAKQGPPPRHVLTAASTATCSNGAARLRREWAGGSCGAMAPSAQTLRPVLRLNDGYAHTSPGLAADVKALQEALRKSGLDTAVDGLFGLGTEADVRAFQRTHGLDEDGIVGPRTWAALSGAGDAPESWIYETTCSPNDPGLLRELELAEKYRRHIESGAEEAGVLPCVVAAIGSRESRWGLALTPQGPSGTGDFATRTRLRAGRTDSLPPDGGGFGRGLMQIDYDFHEFARGSKWKNAKDNILYGCTVLRGNIRLFRRRLDASDGAIVRLSVAAYNCGAGNVLQALEQGRDIDYYTAHRNYSTDVLDRAGWFQVHGWD